MRKHTRAVRDPSPAARLGYHMTKRLATAISRRIAATLTGAKREGPAGAGGAGRPFGKWVAFLRA